MSLLLDRYLGVDLRGMFDVSNEGAHPVYKYAKPFFLGVKVDNEE